MLRKQLAVMGVHHGLFTERDMDLSPQRKLACGHYPRGRSSAHCVLQLRRVSRLSLADLRTRPHTYVLDYRTMQTPCSHALVHLLLVLPRRSCTGSRTRQGSAANSRDLLNSSATTLCSCPSVPLGRSFPSVRQFC